MRRRPKVGLAPTPCGWRAERRNGSDRLYNRTPEDGPWYAKLLHAMVHNHGGLSAGFRDNSAQLHHPGSVARRYPLAASGTTAPLYATTKSNTKSMEPQECFKIKSFRHRGAFFSRYLPSRHPEPHIVVPPVPQQMILHPALAELGRLHLRR